ncbi:MAG: ABC transporter ATP-binding protein [Candidatus Lokiarchaeota archaeon]|nr:ABC transporter ATP-binding protein [Candidatus Lokiarchaeota archaeon]
MLELKRIYHYYGSAKVLEGLDLKIEEKSLNAVIGPNGVGKSTVLRLISGLEKPSRGSIEFLGERIDGLRAHKIAKKGISQSPDRRRLFYDLNVADNIRMGAYLLKDKQEYKKLIDFVYEIFPRLKERRKQRAGTLSGGEQQMLAIARALMSNPKLLLLDEPTVGLAPRVKKKIFGAIKKIKEEGTTTLLVEQDVPLAMEVADNIHVLEEGRIGIRGTKEQLEKEPRIRKVYLGI